MPKTPKTTKPKLAAKARDAINRPIHRTLEFDRATIDKEARSVALAFSSETPVDRYWGREILDHGPGSMRTDWLKSGRAPVLVDHSREDHVGVIEGVTIGDDRVGRATVRFGRSVRANEIFQDVLDGIRQNVSIAYQIHRMDLVSEEDGYGTYRATDWEPLEISMVSLPADMTVGVGRERDPNQPEPEEDTNMENETNTEQRTASPAPVAPSAPAPVNVAQERDNAVKTERQRISEINSLSAKHNCREFGDQHIAAGTALPEFRGLLLERIGNEQPLYTPQGTIGMSPKEIKSYSLLRAISAHLSKDWSKAKFELEASRAVEAQIGRTPQGFFIPYDIQSAIVIPPAGKRDVTMTTPTAGPGSNLKPTDHLGSSFIDLLRNRMLVRSLGVRILTGLRGDIAIPKQIGAGTAYWVTEGNAPTESAQAFSQVTMAPNTLGAFTDISRKMLLQSDPSVEMLVRDDLAQVLALEMDRVVINGSGSGAEPEGILNTNGIGSVSLGTNGGAPEWLDIVGLWRETAIDNADIGSLNFLTNPRVVAKLLTTPKQSSGVEGNFIMNTRDNLMGYFCGVTNQVPATLTKGSGSNLSALLFGNWNDEIIGEWGVLDVLTDPYTGGTAGTLRIRLLMDMDCVTRRAQSFSAITDMVTT